MQLKLARHFKPSRTALRCRDRPTLCTNGVSTLDGLNKLLGHARMFVQAACACRIGEVITLGSAVAGAGMEKVTDADGRGGTTTRSGRSGQ